MVNNYNSIFASQHVCRSAAQTADSLSTSLCNCWKASAARFTAVLGEAARDPGCERRPCGTGRGAERGLGRSTEALCALVLARETAVPRSRELRELGERIHRTPATVPGTE